MTGPIAPDARSALVYAAESRSGAAWSGNPSSSDEQATCRVSDIVRQPLRGADGAYLLVEPQAVFAVGEDLMIAGVPVWATRMDSAGLEVRDQSAGYVGAIVDASGRARLVEAPPGVHRVGWVRAAPSDGEASVWVFQDSLSGGRRSVYAYRRNHWLGPARTLTTGSGEIRVPTSSAIAHGRDWTWVAATRFPNGGVGAQLIRGGSASRVVETLAYDGVDEVGLDPSGSGIWGIAGPDITGASEGVALRVGSEGEPEGAVLDRVPRGSRIRDIRILRGGDRTHAIWRAVGTQWSEARWAVREGAAWSPVRRLAADVSEIVVVSVAGVPFVLRRQADGAAGRQMVVLAHLGADEAIELGRFTSPFTGYFSVVGSDEPNQPITIVGPEVVFNGAEPFVRSLLIRIHVRCDGTAPSEGMNQSLKTRRNP